MNEIWKMLTAPISKDQSNEYDGVSVMAISTWLPKWLWITKRLNSKVEKELEVVLENKAPWTNSMPCNDIYIIQRFCFNP